MEENEKESLDVNKPLDKKSIKILNPFGDGTQYIVFKLNRDANFGLVLKLINKRRDIQKRMREVFFSLQKMKAELKIDELEDKIKQMDKDINSVSEDEILDMAKRFPDEFIQMQNKALNLSDESFNEGIRILSLCYRPELGVPSEYKDNLDFMSNLITSDDEVAQLVDFFLESFDSSMRLGRKNLIIIE